MEIIILIILILLNGIFSMSEMALVSSRKFKLESEMKKGSSGAKTALELAENPNKFLSTVQIGITLIGILLGVFSGDKLTTDLTDFLTKISFIAPYAKTTAAIVMVVIITYFSIVFGELIPKRLGMKFPETVSTIISKPMKFISVVASPFVWLLTVTNDFFLSLFGIKDDGGEVVTEEEIKNIIKESTEGGEIQEKEHEILGRVFELGDRRVNTLATHRSEIVSLDILDDYEQARAKVKKNKFSAYPVTKNNNLDEIVGILKLKDMFGVSKDDFTLKKYVHKPIFVNENSFSYPLLEMLQNSQAHFAVILDEYGTTAGIVTINDILDELVGDTPESQDEDYEIVERKDGTWLIDGQFSIYEFEKFFDIEIDEEIENRYVTVAGIFLDKYETIPNVGDTVVLDDLTLEIIDKGGNRIDKILAYREK